MSHVVQELVFVKGFLIEAERQLQRGDDFGDGLAVSLAQDAAELLLRLVVRERGITIEPSAGLNKLIAAINKAAATESDSVPHLARIEDLNKARVNFKHAGICPSHSDATRLVRFGLEFLEVGFPRFFEIEYRAISLVHQIHDVAVQQFLLEAEVSMKTEDWREAVVAAAKAELQVEAALARLFPPTSGAGLRDGNDAGVVNYLNGLRLIALAGLIGYDPRDLMRFRALAPRVNGGYSGHPPQIVFTGIFHFTRDDAEFCFKFAVDFALAVQRRLG